MAQVVYGIMSDNGDGSASIEWYCNTSEEELMERLEEDPESYWPNEGEISQILTFPDELDLSTVGFYFRDAPEPKKERWLP